MEDLLFTVKETSKILKTNTNYVYRLIKCGYLKCLKLGSYKIRKKTLNEFLEKYEEKLKDFRNLPIEEKFRILEEKNTEKAE